ncbi:putative NADPH-quinone reductase [Pseudomonas sp. SJZ080]|jgi:putative NADPH-quinone reductase|uniref:NAD(P)H-dependent oxidoreductase n=1 Tax=Pseudomonas sp. SJZ080 TaxID=2572888 RepID=UPI00119A533A|nr:NAD(P)H-dependent oxidoreductase [Pseudomonas sp. SJZ080]TWC59204.1 putative NADPH-quinone reductase [Pseudomonas sp. SJZ080]
MNDTTLILSFHPDLGRSHANRAMLDAVKDLEGVCIVDLYGLYPTDEVNIAAEVQRLLSAKRLVLQFPVQWYSTPALLKAWQDSVLTQMYYIAYEVQGRKLEGLPIMVAATAGNTPQAYGETGVNLFPLEQLLQPLRATANRCQWAWCDPFLVYQANKLPSSELDVVAAEYRARIKQFQLKA